MYIYRNCSIVYFNPLPLLWWPADPVVAKVLGDLRSGVFIRCSVGDRDTWKDPENVFRKHPKLQLKGVPTLMRWGTAQKLGPDDCAKEDLVRMLLEED